MTARRSVSLVAVALVASLSLTACGYHQLTQAEFGKTIGKAVAAKKSVHVTGAVTLDVDFSSSTVSVKSERTTNGQKTVLILIGQNGYLKIGDNKFIKFDKDTPLVGQTLAGVDKFNPVVTADLLRDSATSVKYDAAEQIDGKQTYRYKTTLDTAKVLSSFGVQATADDLAKLPKTVDATVWLNPDNTLRRTVVSVPGGASQTTDFTDWGKVHVTAPATSDIEAPPAASPSATASPS